MFAFVVLRFLRIQEQFYLLFPLDVRYMRLEHLSRMLWCLVFVSPVVRVAFYFLNPNNLLIQFVPMPCRMEGLSIGALMAIRFRRGPWEIPKLRLTVLTIALHLVTCVGSPLSKPPRGYLVGV